MGSKKVFQILHLVSYLMGERRPSVREEQKKKISQKKKKKKTK